MKLVLLVAGVICVLVLAMDAKARNMRWSAMSLTEKRAHVAHLIRKERSAVHWWTRWREQWRHPHLDRHRLPPIHYCPALNVSAPGKVCRAGDDLMSNLRLMAKLNPPPPPAPAIAHLALWECIHNGEGPWNADTGNRYYGGLQMTYGWNGLVGNAAYLSPWEQMHAAEEGYRENGYSRWWLTHQWPVSSLSCLQYA